MNSAIRNFIKLIAILFLVYLTACISNGPEITYEHQIIKPNYRITLSEDKSAIFIAGHIELGISNDVIGVFNRNKSTVKSLVYKSYGGRLYQSENLHRLAKRHNLNTYAMDFCSSACTVAFMGGSTRFIRKGTKLGFHQYRNAPGFNYDIKALQNKHRQMFRMQGVKEDFLTKAFKAKNSNMWKPSLKVLIRANVVNALLNRDDVPYFNYKNKNLYPKIWKSLSNSIIYQI